MKYFDIKWVAHRCFVFALLFAIQMDNLIHVHVNVIRLAGFMRIHQIDKQNVQLNTTEHHQTVVHCEL